MDKELRPCGTGFAYCDGDCKDCDKRNIISTSSTSIMFTKSRAIDVGNVFEMLCAAINDCEDKGMSHTVETLNAVLKDLEDIFGRKSDA